MLYRKCVRKMCIHTQPEGGAGRLAGDAIVVLGADRPVSGHAGSSLVEDVGSDHFDIAVFVYLYMCICLTCKSLCSLEKMISGPKNNP